MSAISSLDSAANPHFVDLLRAREEDVDVVHWFNADKHFLTRTGYNAYYRTYQKLTADFASFGDYLRHCGFQSIADHNKTQSNYDQLTLWISPEGRLINRREYVNYVYRSRLENLPVAEYLTKYGYRRLRKS